jgi:two-component system, response regulator PdtaR
MSLLNDAFSPAAQVPTFFGGPRMLSESRLLIVEEQFLIALDIQRVVEEAHARQTVFARNYDEVAALLLERPAQFELAILTPPRPGTADEACAGRLIDGGAAIVVCTATPIDLGGTRLAVAEVVYKPFLDGDLLAACRRALDKRSGD